MTGENWLKGWTGRYPIFISKTPGAEPDYQLNSKLFVKKGDYIYRSNSGSLHIFRFLVRPPAVYYNNKTYVTFQGDDLDPYVTYYDHSTSYWADEIVKVGNNPLTGDDYGAPALVIDSLGKIHIFFGNHASEIKHSVSEIPENITRWKEESSPIPGINSTYLSLFKDKNEIIYLFAQVIDGKKVGYVYSSNNTTSWSALKVLVSFTQAVHPSAEYNSYNHTIGIYWAIPGTFYHKNLYYAYLNLDNFTLYSQEGDNLGSMIDEPTATSYCKILGYDDMTGRILHFDKSGYPHIMFAYGMNGYLRFKTWNGTNWVLSSLLGSGFGEAGDFYFENSNQKYVFVSAWSVKQLRKYFFDGSNWSYVGMFQAPNRFGTSRLVCNFKEPIVLLASEVIGVSVGLYCLDKDLTLNKFIRNGLNFEETEINDFPELLFTKYDGITRIPHFIEKIKTKDFGNYWLKIPNSPDPGALIYLYKGNVSSKLVSENIFTQINSTKPVVLHFLFEEGAGRKTLDKSGLNLEGEFGSYVKWSTGYPIGKAVVFSGIYGDYLAVAHTSYFNFSTNDFAIEVMINRFSPKSGGAIVEKHDAAWSKFWYLAEWTDLRLQFITNEIELVTLPLPKNEWHHVVVNKSGTNVAFYIDGVFVSSQDGMTQDEDSTEVLHIGGCPLDEDWWDGFKMAYLRIYNGRALTETEISQLANGYGLAFDSYPRQVLVKKITVPEPVFESWYPVETENAIYKNVIKRELEDKSVNIRTVYIEKEV